MATKIQTPLSKAAASGKIVKGKVVDTKKAKFSPKTAALADMDKKVPAKKAPAKKAEVAKPSPAPASEKKERKESAKGLIAKMVAEQAYTDDEIHNEVGPRFPETYKRAYISATRGSMNRGEVYQTLAEGLLPLNPVYKDEKGKILSERPSKAAAKAEKQPVKKAALNLLKKTKDSLPTE